MSLFWCCIFRVKLSAVLPRLCGSFFRNGSCSFWLMREDICIAMKSWRWIVMAAKLALILSIYLSKRSHYLSNIVLKLQGPSLNTKFVSFSTVNPNGNDHLTWKIDCLFSREPLFWMELYFRCANITAQLNLANKNFLCPAFRDLCEKVYGTRNFFFKNNIC